MSKYKRKPFKRPYKNRYFTEHGQVISVLQLNRKAAKRFQKLINSNVLDASIPVEWYHMYVPKLQTTCDDSTNIVDAGTSNVADSYIKSKLKEASEEVVITQIVQEIKPTAKPESVCNATLCISFDDALSMCEDAMEMCDDEGDVEESFEDAFSPIMSNLEDLPISYYFDVAVDDLFTVEYGRFKGVTLKHAKTLTQALIDQGIISRLNGVFVIDYKYMINKDTIDTLKILDELALPHIIP